MGNSNTASCDYNDRLRMILLYFFDKRDRFFFRMIRHRTGIDQNHVRIRFPQGNPLFQQPGTPGIGIVLIQDQSQNLWIK